MMNYKKFAEIRRKENKYMITLFRMIRLWQLRTKYRLALWQFIDQQAKELLKNPEEIEKKFVSALAEIIHNENPNRPTD